MLKVSKSIPGLALLAALVLSACGTPEYRAEQKHCKAEWMVKIPPIYQQRIVTRYRTEERLTGRTICKTVDSVTHCTQLTRFVSVPYPEIETVDIRAAQRNPQIESCTVRACAAKYGNNKCET